MSFVSAPPRAQIYEVASVYGALTGSLSTPRTRFWILLQDNDPAKPFARICRNDGNTGAPVWTDLGFIASATSRPGRIEVELVDGSNYVLVEAPCVCGAGAAGMAGPVNDRYEIHRVRVDELPWLTILP